MGADRALTAAIPARGSGSHRRYTPRQAQVAYVLGLLSELGAGTPLMERVSDLLEGLPRFSGRLVCDPDGYVAVNGPLGIAAWTIDLDRVGEVMGQVLPEPVPA